MYFSCEPEPWRNCRGNWSSETKHSPASLHGHPPHLTLQSVRIVNTISTLLPIQTVLCQFVDFILSTWVDIQTRNYFPSNIFEKFRSFTTFDTISTHDYNKHAFLVKQNFAFWKQLRKQKDDELDDTFVLLLDFCMFWRCHYGIDLIFVILQSTN